MDGTDERLVGDFEVAAFPAWSVDGRQITFSAADASDTFRLYTASIERDRPTAITPLGPDAMLPAWSPDGSTIAYARSPDASRGSYDLWLVNPDGTDNRSLTDDPTNELRPAWSPDGKRIALVANGALSVIDAVSGRGPGCSTMTRSTLIRRGRRTGRRSSSRERS